MYGLKNETEFQDYLINFANHLDPNGPTPKDGVYWPKWNSSNPQVLQLQDGAVRVALRSDTYRQAGMNTLITIQRKTPLRPPYSHYN